MKLTRSFSFENALHLANLSQLAYNTEDVVKEKCGYKNVKFFDKFGAQCYGFENSDHIVLSFRGTEPTTTNDIKADLNIFHGRDYEGIQEGRVHTGFRDEVDTLWSDITEWLSRSKNKQIYTCGHSLGGAMSCIAASRLKGYICYNYGCPRVGTGKWKKAAEKNNVFYRFVNDRDIVPRIPPRWMNYRHLGELYFIDRKGEIIKNPNPWKSFKKGLANMCRNPLRITQGISDHSMSDYCKFIKEWIERV